MPEMGDTITAAEAECRRAPTPGLLLQWTNIRHVLRGLQPAGEATEKDYPLAATSRDWPAGQGERRTLELVTAAGGNHSAGQPDCFRSCLDRW